MCFQSIDLYPMTVLCLYIRCSYRAFCYVSFVSFVSNYGTCKVFAKTGDSIAGQPWRKGLNGFGVYKFFHSEFPFNLLVLS